MRRPSPVLLAVGVGALAACATLFSAAGPKQTIKIPHAKHVAGDVECLACHETIFDATSLAMTNLPREKKCLECHKEEKEEKQNCAFCHVGEPQTYAKKDRELVFNHARHLEENEDCAVCHKELPEPGKLASVSPPMDACTGCHQHQEHFDQGRCEECHTDLGRHPLKPISSFSHQADYLRLHGRDAKASSACATCHEQTFCADCHAQNVAALVEVRWPERVDRQFLHRNDFISRHPIEARNDGEMCLRCHSVRSCESCHAERGLTTSADPNVNPHPDGYGSSHGHDARTAITTCAACHDQGADSICVDCHRVGGIGGNPHPPTWSGRHGTEEISRNATCLVCHQ